MAGYTKAWVRSDMFTPHIRLAQESLKKFMVGFMGNDDWPIGSGTLVKTCGFEGILTAHHVASEILSLPSLGMCVVDNRHKLTGPPSGLENIPIGASPRNGPPDAGPDLSFLIIRDPTLLSVLRKLKSFYPISKPPSLHPVLGNPRMWSVTGTISVSSRRIEHEGEPITKARQFLGGGRFPHASNKHGELDYVRLTIPSGSGFPDDYQGMSGGGFWLLAMEIDPANDPRTIRHRQPVLAGVEFAQLGRKDGERVLVGHGPDSIYSRLQQSIRRCVVLGLTESQETLVP